MAREVELADGVVDVERAAVAVEDEEEVAHALEVGGDALLEFRRIGAGGRAVWSTLYDSLSQRRAKSASSASRWSSSRTLDWRRSR